MPSIANSKAAIKRLVTNDPETRKTSFRLRRHPGLFDRPILIIEDEELIAADLAHQIIQDGCKVAGPVLSIADAERTLKAHHELGGVILDVNINGTTTLSLADSLVEAAIPFVFFTGYRSIEIPDRFIAVPQVTKPAGWRQLKTALQVAAERLRHTGVGSFRESIERALPALRQRARHLVRNPEDADRLVERTLERAISAVGDRSLHIPIEDWLLSLIEDGRRARHHLH
jgi:FixJ family two-component response regulator